MSVANKNLYGHCQTIKIKLGLEIRILQTALQGLVF